MTLLPLNLRFGFEDALQQDGIFRHHTPLLDLQDLDQSALLGEFVFPGRQLLGDDPAIAGATQLVDHRTMIGVNRVAADTRLTCEISRNAAETNGTAIS